MERGVSRERRAIEWNTEARLGLVLTDDPMTDAVDAFGSYLVYRKISQNVHLFSEQIKILAAKLNITEDLTGAMVVGRFEDGTPVYADSVHGPGNDVQNDLNYKDDADGFKCPLHAHIRKVNPRGTTPLTSDEFERGRRIVRRGIPYGEPVGTPGKPTGVNDNASSSRGLLFICYQSNIEEHFEFIQRTWVDNESFPQGILFQKDTGDDPLIGHNHDEAQRWPKKGGINRRGPRQSILIRRLHFEAASTSLLPVFLSFRGPDPIVPE